MRLLMKSVQALLVLEAVLTLYNAVNKFKLNNVVNFECALGHGKGFHQSRCVMLFTN
jgi:hypothetical protein